MGIFNLNLLTAAFSIPDDNRPKHPGIWFMVGGLVLWLPLLFLAVFNQQIPNATQEWLGPIAVGCLLAGGGVPLHWRGALPVGALHSAKRRIPREWRGGESRI